MDNTSSYNATMADKNDDDIDWSQISLLQRAMTAATVCSPGEVCPDMNMENINIDLFHNTVELAKAVDGELQKALGFVAKQMTVNKAIVEDAEVISILLQRLFS